MLEVKKGLKVRGNIASVIANLEKRQKKEFSGGKVKKNDFGDEEEKNKEDVDVIAADNKENSNGKEKESESDSDLERAYELDRTGKPLNTITEEEGTRKGVDDSNSSPEESTIKHTWSGSASPAAVSSGSDFTSSDENEEYKRNSMTKDCNADFRWIISDKQAETKSLFDSGQDIKKKEETKSKSKFPNFYDDLKIEEGRKTVESNPFFSMDRNRKILEFRNCGNEKQIDLPLSLRLPPQSPGSLDRKRTTKTRAERDQKCKSSVVTRSRKSPSRIFPDNFSSSRKFEPFYYHDAFRDDLEHDCRRKERSKFVDCCSNSNSRRDCSYGRCRCHLGHQTGCTNYYGSYENIQDKPNRKNSFGSQKSLIKICEVYDDRNDRNPRNCPWHGSQTKLYPTTECSCNNYHCQMLDRDKSQSHCWRPFDKNDQDLEDRLIRLENDKESLQLQVAVLTEQVEAQSEKISDLQQNLEDKKQQLNKAEDLLQREMLTRSSVETQKLELLSVISEMKLQHASLERENYELKEEKKRYQSIKPPIMPRNTSPALLQSTPVVSSRYSPNEYLTRKPANPFSNQELYLTDSSCQNNPFSDSHHKYISSSTPNSNSNNYNNSISSINSNSNSNSNSNHVANLIGSPSQSPVVLSNSKRDDLKHFSGTQPNFRRNVDQYNSLPRQKLIETELYQVADVHRKGVVFGKGKPSLITLKSEKSYSAPNLAETEKAPGFGNRTNNLITDVESLSITDGVQTQNNPKKGIKKIFQKIKRSNSGNVNDLLGDGDFKRGGIRATAGPRLGGALLQIHQVPDKPFVDWDTDNLCNWLEYLGLENYVADMRRWVKDGNHLLSASSHDLEKELGMKNPLHKKKLLLALQEVSEKGPAADELLKPAGRLDTHWVLRWLDDVGLPQHKEVFLTARVDGRMLHRLTMDDLATLHITSVLHVASLKRGIKVLRERKMDPTCLTRRSIPDEPVPTAVDVALWTNHRVMEWLRVVDLAEYAPNLRGSGVHGALMVYETKFTAELLASLLSIPPNKTLLRRHLNTHFKELLGRDVIQKKREAETTLGYIPLTPSAKVKTIKKPQFTLKRKKSKNEFDYGDLVCPFDDATSGEQSAPSNTCVGVSGDGMMKEKRHVPDVCPVTDPSPRDSPITDRLSRM